MSHLVKEPLSNHDLDYLLKDMNNELGEKKNINIFTISEMLKNPQEFIRKLKQNHYSILFIENNGTNIGHWVCVYENLPQKQIYFYDSYGDLPQKYSNDLYLFFKRYIPNIKCSTIQYQKERDDINTCGRWCMLQVGLNRIINNFSPEKFKNVFNYFKKLYKKPNDEIVAGLINFDL